MSEQSDEATPTSGGKALPRPKRTLRTATLAVMATCTVVASLLAYSILDEARYALDASEARDLGDAKTADLAANEGRYVRAHVTLDEPKAAFRRPLEPIDYRVAGAGDGLFVVYGMPDGYAEAKFVPPRLVSGRLTKASSMGVRFGGVSGTTGRDAWVIVDGDAPYGLTWLLGVEAMLLGFVLFNLGGIVRVMRRVR